MNSKYIVVQIGPHNTGKLYGIIDRESNTQIHINLIKHSNCNFISPRDKRKTFLSKDKGTAHNFYYTDTLEEAELIYLLIGDRHPKCLK